MSCFIIYNDVVYISGNDFRSNLSPTPEYNYFRTCSMGILFPLSFESNSIADWLDYGDSVLCFPVGQSLKAVLLTTESRIVEITIVNEKGIYDFSTVIMPLDKETVYYMDKDNEITSALHVAMKEQNPIHAVHKLMSSSYADGYKKLKTMDLKKIFELFTDQRTAMHKGVIPFRNPNYKEKQK